MNTTPTTPEPYWVISVHTDNGKGTDNGFCGCSVSTGAATLGELLAEAFQCASYYLGLGYRVEIQEAEQLCGSCRGAGQHRRGVRAIRYVKCKHCKGKGILQTVSTRTEIKLSEALTLQHSAKA